MAQVESGVMIASKRGSILTNDINMMNENLLRKYLSNSCNDQELSEVIQWIKKDADTVEGRELLHGIWSDTQDESQDDVKYSEILELLHQRIRFSDEWHKRRNKHRLTEFLSKIAAALMLPLLGYALFITARYDSSKKNIIAANQSFNEIYSSVDAITKVTLPDGSKVWLNHSSSLKYPSAFMGSERTVELDGEGYFDVVSNPKLPFIVKAGEMKVIARGTTFNILAYHGDNNIETSLVKGSVDLVMEENRGSPVPLLRMKASERTVYKRNEKTITTLHIEDDRYYSWKDGKLIFKKEPLGEVVRKMSRWFNVDIMIKDEELLDLTYTATFINETLPQVLELLALATPVTYSISNREDNGDGTFSKRRVILTKLRTGL